MHNLKSQDESPRQLARRVIARADSRAPPRAASRRARVGPRRRRRRALRSDGGRGGQQHAARLAKVARLSDAQHGFVVVALLGEDGAPPAVRVDAEAFARLREEEEGARRDLDSEGWGGV